MKQDAFSSPSKEVQLKLALPTSDPAGLAKRLVKVPALRGCKPTNEHLHNVYYDTPEQVLRQEHMALRIRCTNSDAKFQWMQTLKTGAGTGSPSSERWEWDPPVSGAQLSLDALLATPWKDIDPDNSLFSVLAPVFVTSFDRTNWLVRGRDDSQINVSLDLGFISADEKSTPICELELELVVGHPAALLALAQKISASIAVLPANSSKDERGYALAKNCLDLPVRARPPELTDDLSVSEAARRVLCEMFCQFTGNLNLLLTSDAPEVVHQARVGWRRFKSALRLFKPFLRVPAPPSWQELDVLLTSLGHLRDLDVAHFDTLPPYEGPYVGGDAKRLQTWQAMMLALTDASQLQRKAIRDALQEPAIGAKLLVTTRWLEAVFAPNSPEDVGAEKKVPLRRWSRRRIDRLQRQLKAARFDIDKPDSQHRVRILAKRLRYSIEALRSLLPKRRANRLCLRATGLQLSLGATRDTKQAGVLLTELGVHRELVEFLRGVAVGQKQSS